MNATYQEISGLCLTEDWDVCREVNRAEAAEEFLLILYRSHVVATAGGGEETGPETFGFKDFRKSDS